MDDTTFREILRAVDEEAAADPSREDVALAAANITGTMLAHLTPAQQSCTFQLCIHFTHHHSLDAVTSEGTVQPA